MKIFAGYFTLAFIFSTLILSAQGSTHQFIDPRPLTDKGEIELLQKDFDMRHSTIPDLVVAWYTSDYDYYGKYTINDMNFIVRYNKNANYVETLSRKDWSRAARTAIKNSFSSSEYKDLMIVAYWEVTEPESPECYIELKAKNGKFISIWADNRGNFSTIPNRTQ